MPPISANALIAGRYRLLEQLGAGAMGEVWKALDERFEVPRPVAIKVLKEDESLREDQRVRDSLARILQNEARDGLTTEFVVRAFEEALHHGPDAQTLRRRVLHELGGGRDLSVGSVLDVYDVLANDPAINDNARVREKLRKLFKDEANSVANLRHDNIVSTFDTGLHEGLPFLVMDYIEGRTLLRVIQRGERLSRGRQLRLMEDLCEGLHFAHGRKLVHRDIKPANLIIDATTERLKILDFGVVKRMERIGDATSTFGGPVGTFCYMSPEQSRGSASLDQRSDIFAVGSVFYELLAGRKAFPAAGTLAELFARIQTTPPAPLTELCPDLQPEIERIVYRALEKDPELRYQNLGRMKRDIERIRMRLDLDDDQGDQEDPTEIRRGPRVSPTRELMVRAEAAFEAGDDAEAIKLSNEALKIDRELAAATELLAKARERRAQRQVDQWLNEARLLIDRGDLTAAESRVKQVLSVQPGSSQAADVGQAIAAGRARAAAEEQRAQAERLRVQRLAELVAAGRRALDAGDYQRTLAAAEEIERLDAKHGEAKSLRTAARRGLDEQRQQAAFEARVSGALERADAEAGAGRLDQAIAILAEITPAPPQVAARLAALRLASEQRTKAKRLASQARAAHDAGDFHKAVALLDEAAAIQAEDRDAVRLRAAAAAAIERAELAARQEREASAHVQSAEQLERADRLDEALAEGRRALAVRPDHPAATALMRRLEEKLAAAEQAELEARRQHQADARVQTAARLERDGRLDEALDEARQALQLVPSHAAATALAQRIDEAMAARERARHDRRVDAAIREADADFAGRRYQAAFARLEAIDDPRAAGAAERLRAQAEAILASVQPLIDEAAYAQALAVVADVEPVFPGRADVVALRQRLERSVDEDARVTALFATARQALADGELDRAEQSARAVLALRPARDDAHELMRRVGEARDRARLEALEREVSEVIAEAQRTFAAQRFDAAIAQLRDFAPPHPRVEAELTRLVAEYDAVQQRATALHGDAERALDAKDYDRAAAAVAELEAAWRGAPALAALSRRLEQETARRIKVNGLLDRAGAEPRTGRSLERAAAIVAQALTLEPDYAPALALRDALVDAIAARDRRAGELSASAREALETQDYERAGAALADLEALLPDAAAFGELSRRLRDETARRAKVDGLLEEADADLRKARPLERAAASVRQALDLEPGYPPAVALERKIAEAIGARDRAALAARVAAAQQKAAALAAKQRYQKAIALLEGFEPPHPEIASTLETVRAAAARHGEDEARRKAERPARAPANVIALAGAAALALSLAVGGWFWLSRAPTPTPTPPSASTAQQQAATLPLAPPVQPEPAPAGPVEVPVSFDAKPWARVTIRPADAASDAPPSTLETPASIALRPGRYTVELTNDFVTRAMQRQVTVEAGKTNAFRFTMTGFNTENVISQLVGPERD